MKRWVPVFVLFVVWLGGGAVVPRARDFARYSMDPWPDAQIFLYSDYVVPGRGKLDVATESIERHDRILRRFPNDRQVRLRWAAAGMPDRAEKELDRLSADFPNDAAFLATRLAVLSVRAKDNRAQGPFTKTTTGTTPPEPYVPLTAEEKRVVRKMLRLAREGQRVEPDNQLFDWYEMYALFALRRDAEVIPVLRRAALKKTYRDYFLQGVTAEYEVRSRERLLAPQEVVALWQTFPNAYRYEWQQVTRLLMDRVLEARHRGDKQLPLEIGQALIKLGRCMRLQDPTAGGALSGMRLEYCAISLWRQRVKGQLPNPKIPDNMADFAVATGNRRLAREVMNERNIIGGWRSGVRKAYIGSAIPIWSDDVPPPFVVLRVIEKAGNFFMSAACYLVPLWLVLWLLALRNQIPIEGSSRVLDRAILFGGLVGFFTLAMLLVADVLFLFQPGSASYISYGATYVNFPGLTLAAPHWIVALPVICLLLWPLYLVTRWQKRMTPLRQSWAEAMVTAGAGSDLTNVVVGYAFPIIGMATYVILCFAAAGFYCWETRPEDAALSSLEVSAGITVAFLVPFAWEWKSHRRRRLALVLWLRAARYAIAGYLVTMGLCYGLVLLALAPALATTHQYLELVLRHGDLNLIRTAGGF